MSHIRGICRACDPCTATLLAAANTALAAEQRPALAGMVAAHPDECVPTHELVA